MLSCFPAMCTKERPPPCPSFRSPGTEPPAWLQPLPQGSPGDSTAASLTCPVARHRCQQRTADPSGPFPKEVSCSQHLRSTHWSSASLPLRRLIIPRGEEAGKHACGSNPSACRYSAAVPHPKATPARDSVPEAFEKHFSTQMQNTDL